MTESLRILLVLIPALPLAAAIVTAVFGRALGERSHVPVVLGIAGSFLCSLGLLAQVNERSQTEEVKVGWEATTNLWNWVNVGDAIATPAAAHAAGDDAASAVLPAMLPFRIDVTLRADALTAIMLSTVTFISTLVAIYASGYMHGDRG